MSKDLFKEAHIQSLCPIHTPSIPVISASVIFLYWHPKAESLQHTHAHMQDTNHCWHLLTTKAKAHKMKLVSNFQ